MESLIEKKLLCSSSSSDSGVGQISYICVPVARDELFPWIDQTFPGQQDQAVRHLTKLFSSSVHNKVVATEARVTGYIAEHLGGFCEDKYFEAMLALFVELSKFSVEGEDIKTFYSYVTGKRPICRGLPCKQRARQLQAYRALVDILNGSDVTWPLKFFLLEGERNEASIQMRANTSFDKKWPSEYAFMIWVMFDDIPTKDSKYEPRLINFTSNKSIGFEVLLKGKEMVIRTCGGNSYANMEHSFQVGQWYHICFFHYYEKELFFKYPTLAVYVNGRLAHKQILKFPSTSGPLFQRVIGNVKTQTFVKRTADTTLRGGIASVAIGAGAPLAPAAVARLYSQGPEFIPTTHYLRTALRSIIALDFVVTPHALEPIAVASRTRTRARTKSTTKRSEAAAAAAAEEEASDEEEITGCYNTDFVPLKKGGPEDAGCGVLFPGVRTVNCTSAKTAFFAAVGVKALLPLFHPAVLERWPGVSLELAAKAVTAALRNDKREYIEYARVKGSEVIAGLLLQAANWPVKGKKACKNEGKSESESDGGVNTSETASTDNSSQKFLISDGAIAAFRELGGILEMFPRTRGMAYRPLLLNFGCWRGASPQVQHNLAEAALMTLTLNPRYSRRYVGVGSILAGLDKYSTATVGGEGGEGINAEDAIVIREILCRILEFFYLEAGERITREEVAALVAFVKVSTAPGDIRCAMNVLMKALQASRRAFTDFFTDTCDGGNLFLRLAGHEDAEVRILGIKAAGLFLYRSADAPQQKAVVRDFPFDKLCDVLLRYPFDYKTYLAMVQLYTMDYADDVCSVAPKCLARQKSYQKTAQAQKVFEAIMDLLAHEIEQQQQRQQQHGDSDPATAESFAGISKIIDDITITIDRNKPFQDIVASYKGWYLKFLLVLYRLSRLQGSTSPQSSQSQAICALEDNLYTVISTLLSIALSGAGGWHVVEDAFLYARGVWNWQRTSEIDPGSGEQDAWRGVCLRIAYQLMEFITLIVSAEAPRGEDATAVWANFVNLAGMVEAIMFTEPTPPPSSALLLKKLSPAAAAALESAWPNFGPGYLRVRKGEDGTEQWTDFVLALKTLRIYDMLWAYEEVKACAAVTLETVYGRKRAAATVFLRISLAVLFYMKQFFLGGSSNSGSGEDEGGQKAKTKAKKERQQMAVYREVCMNDAGRIIDLIGVITKAGGNANALLLVWALCAILEALHKTKLSADGNESEKMLFAVVQQAGVMSQSAVESAIPSLKPVETVSAPQPTLQPQSKENSLEGNSSTAATNAEPTEENNTTNEITNNDRDKAFDKVFAHINEKFEVFIGCWIAEFYGVSESKARAAVASIKKLVTDVEKKEFSRQHAAGQAKADGQAKNLGEEVVKTSGARRVAQDSTAKDLARYEERMRLLAGERQSFLAFQAQDARRVAWKAVRRIVRAVAHAEGCWDYKTGRALYAATPLTEEEEEEEDKLIRCHIQESDEDKCEQGGEGKDSAGNVGDNNDGDEEYPLWKVDSFVRDDVFIRPFVRVDYSGDLNPRRKDFDSVTGNNNNNSVKPTTGREEKEDEEEEEKEGKEGKEEIVMPTVGEEFISVIRCERVSFARRIPGTLCFTARRLFFFAAGDRDGSHGFKAWPLEALRRLFVHHFALVHGLKVLAGSRLYLFEAEARGECLKFAKTLAAAAAERGALRGTGALVADPVRALRKEGWTERWVRGELSNFQYLMVLNTYGGRMFGDMSRYPVFPWVLTDYAGASAGLGSPEAFRDLAKPVGALNEKRLQDFLQRYHVMQRDRMVGAMLPFMYGSHYSTQGSTMFWLMRTEPVASACRDLQGGHFDHPDRLFFSVETAWSNSLTNTSDVKELVPEFFFFPEFLRNANRYWFGHMQSGLLVDDVLLPPWACGSPELFVRFCAEALESPYASAHLHQWIDLIFGASQTGKAAEAANNVFYYLTYPKDVDKAVAATKDSPVEAQAIRTQLTYFGQCPTHLFLKPHPPRKTPSQQQQQQQKKAVIAGPMPPTSISVETLPMPIRGKKKKAAGSLGSGCGVAPLMTAVLQRGSASDADASVVVVEATHEVTLIDPFLLRKSGGKDGAWTLPYSARPPLCYCTHLLRPAHIIAATLAGTSFFVAPLAHQKVTAVAEVVNAVGYGDEVTALALNRPGASCGSLLAVGGHKGLCTIWSLDSHRCLSSVAAATMAAAAAATSTGSGSGSGNGIVGSVDVDSGSSSVGIIDGNNNDCFDDDDDDNNDNNGGGGVGNNSNSNGEKKTQGNESGGGDAMAIPNVTEENLLVPSQRGPSMILREQHSAVLKVCFSDDSSVCATGAADGTVCLYHIEDGRAWFAAAIHRPPNNASSSNNNNTNNTSEVAALAFTRTRNDLVILWKGDKAVHFATVNGRIYDSVPLSGNNTTNSNSIGGAVDMFVTMRGPCSEYVVVLDKHGIFFISVDLVQLPNARCKAYWALPSPPGSTVTIVGGGQVGKRWAPKTPNYLGPMEDMGGIGGGGGGNSLVSNDAAAALTAVAGSNNSNSSSSTPEPQDSLETMDKDGGNGDENKGSNGESGAVMPKQQQQPIETKLTSGKGGHEVNIFLVCMVTSASPNASGNGTTSCVNTTRQYMIVSI